MPSPSPLSPSHLSDETSTSTSPPTPPPRPQRQWHQRQHFPGVTLLILPLPMGHLRSHMSVGSSRGTSSRTRRGRAREPGRKKKLLTRTRRITYYGDADRVDMQLLDDVLREAHAAAAGAVGEWSDRDLSAKSPQHLMMLDRIPLCRMDCHGSCRRDAIRGGGSGGAYQV